jgi:hypothetical protein
MKPFGLWAGAGLLAVSITSASAQISVQITLDQEQFLQGESLPAAVRITNRSGQPLHLGAQTNWLTFGIEALDGTAVVKLGDVPVEGEFTLESSKKATKRVDLSPYFAITHPGRYRISAVVHLKDWDQDVAASPGEFNIIEGAKLWDQTVGLPRSSEVTNGVPELRRYILQQANYLKGQIRLYLRITDAYGKTLRVFPVGSMVSFSRPNFQVDKASELHVLYQNGPYTYSYTHFSPDGDLLARQTYDYVTTRPQLRGEDDGGISVKGGSRRVTPNDVPPPPETPENEATPSPPPPQTAKPKK